MSTQTPAAPAVAEGPWDVPLLGATKIAAGAAVLATGFFAVSDDDFSRVVIAQRFAALPRLDPSGTSWLPFPFWLTGGLMSLLGRNLEMARGIAIVSGVISVLLVHRAALLLGTSRLTACLGAALAGAIPTSARLGVSFQPEALAAGLVVLGAASATRDEVRVRAAGAVALGAACLCRYEAWAAALAFAAFTLSDVRRIRSPRLAIAAGIAIAAPALWMAHGARAHGSAMFFLARVGAFRRALGDSESLGEALAAYPTAFFTAEPELCLAGGAAILGALLSPDVLRASRPGGVATGRSALRAFVRPAAIVGATLALLVAGRLADGAPTHHPERTLLPAYTLLAVAAVAAAELQIASRRAASLLALCAALGLFIRWLAPDPRFESRDAERSVGEVASRKITPSERLAVDTPDYGYFAVLAAFGAPERADTLATHDPREPEPDDPFRNEAALRARLAALGATWLVAHREHWPVAEKLGESIAARGDLALIRVGSKRP